LISGSMYRSLIASILLLAPLSANELSLQRYRVTYLAQAGNLTESLALYQQQRTASGKHDFEILQQLAIIILQEGAKSEEPKKQLLSIYGSSLGGMLLSLEILEMGLRSPMEQAQLAAVHYLGQIQDDFADELLLRAMSSDSFYTRYEAAAQLALRKHPAAVGQIESLMNKLRREFHFLFAGLFAEIGTNEAIGPLRHLMQDPIPYNRVAALLATAQLGRDDLLPAIRAAATHNDLGEQEAAVMALGMLRDSKSLPLLHKSTTSPSDDVRLASLLALHRLGDLEAGKRILEEAKKTMRPQAISLLGTLDLNSIEGSEEWLVSLLTHSSIQTRVNAAMSLLHQRNPRCRNVLIEILIRDTRDLAFLPNSSHGRSLPFWKVLSSATAHQKQMGVDLVEFSVGMRERVLAECIELPDAEFLLLAGRIFRSGQTELVPMLIELLLNKKSPEALALLEAQTQAAGSPLLRCYSSLALMRLSPSQEHAALLREWVLAHAQQEMIHFRPTATFEMRADQKFELTPAESSRLLIGAVSLLAEGHSEPGIDLILELIQKGHPSNRYVLAGLLLHALQ